MGVHVPYVSMCAPLKVQENASRVDSSVFGGYNDRWERIDTLTPQEDRMDGSGFQNYISGTQGEGKKSL